LGRRRWTPQTYLTQDELRRLLGAVRSPRDRALLLLAYRHGLRASEVGLLRLSDLDLERARIRIRRLKGSLGGEHPLQPDEVRLLRAWLRRRKDTRPWLFPSRRGTPISRKTLDYLMKRYGAAAGLPPEKRHFHVLKHSIATHLLEAGADVMFVREWLGHANIANTVVYARLTARALEERALTLFRSRAIVGP